MKYRFVLTCRCCPEQYDVYDDETGLKVAYVRYRHSFLEVNPVLPEFETYSFVEGGREFTDQIYDFDHYIYTDGTIGHFDGIMGWDGELPDDRREEILEMIDQKIQEYYEKKAKGLLEEEEE